MCIKRERGGGKKEHTQGLHSSFREDDKGQVRSSSTTSSMHQYSSRTTTGKINKTKKGERESDRGGGHLQLIHSFKKSSPD